MRKILYSPGYGEGWSTWNAHTKEQIRFLTEYPPLIEYVEGNGGDLPNRRGVWFEDEEEKILAIPAIQQLIREWKEKFPDEPELYLGGIKGLSIRKIPSDMRYFIEEYDGSESVITEKDIEDRWL